MTYLAITSVRDSRVALYQSFGKRSDAVDHVNQFGGFVFRNVENWPTHLMRVVGEAVTIVEPTEEEQRAAMPALTARQIRLGLLHSGTTEGDVAVAIGSIADDTHRAVADIEWRTATKFERLHPFVVDLGAALGYTPEEIDALWFAFLQI